MEEDRAQPETVTVPQPKQLGAFPLSTYSVKLAPVVLPVTGENSMENLTLGPSSNQQRTITKPIRPIPILPVPPSSNMADLNLSQKARQTQIEPLPLSLKLSAPSSSSSDEKSAPKTSHSSAFQAMSSGDSIISVA